MSTPMSCLPRKGTDLGDMKHDYEARQASLHGPFDMLEVSRFVGLSSTTCGESYYKTAKLAASGLKLDCSE
jgi:hypothetical protein